MQEATNTPIERPSFEIRQALASGGGFHIQAGDPVRLRAALRIVVFRLLNAWCIWSGAVRSLYWHIRLQSPRETPTVSLGAASVLYPDGSHRDQPGTSARAASIENLLATYPWLDIVHLRIFLMGFDAGERIHAESGDKGNNTQNVVPS